MKKLEEKIGFLNDSEGLEKKDEIIVYLDELRVPEFLAEVLQIESASFDSPWEKQKFIEQLRNPNCKGVVAKYQDCIVGFMIYELYKTRIHLLSFAVDPIYRRMGVGTQMIVSLVSDLTLSRRNRIILEVRETNLPAQLFFRSCEFRYITTLRNHFPEIGEDAYLMQYKVEHPSKNRHTRPTCLHG